eukprot:Phypoly_transcript_16501.p1 GENE.Phypoly_transcript_16501~~Phypoly_transcript_16501.p1  ORF type:complete len:105 (+),score=17.84 Phypoly_transcript_16501:506-820(+)
MSLACGSSPFLSSPSPLPFLFLLLPHFFLNLQRYIISLESGESFYKTMEGTVKSKGVKQRTHQITVQDGDIYVILSTPKNSGTSLASDHYCPETLEEKKRMGLI